LLCSSREPEEFLDFAVSFSSGVFLGVSLHRKGTQEMSRVVALANDGVGNPVHTRRIPAGERQMMSSRFPPLPCESIITGERGNGMPRKRTLPEGPSTKTTIDVPNDLWRATRMHALETGTSANAIVLEALKKHLDWKMKGGRKR
jgi:hypothetical protein